MVRNSFTLCECKQGLVLIVRKLVHFERVYKQDIVLIVGSPFTLSERKVEHFLGVVSSLK